MTSSYKHLLPEAEEISDEAAAVLTEVLFRLAGACDVRYLDKILRYQDAQTQERHDVDPEQPWRRPPPT
jgi:hypothetical protein